MLDKSCSFTGHRPHKFPWKYDEANSRCVSLKAKLTEQITWKILAFPAMLYFFAFTTGFYRAALSPKGFADLYAARTVHLRFIAASGAEQSAS